MIEVVKRRFLLVVLKCPLFRRNNLVAAGAVTTEAAGATLNSGVLGNGDDIDGDGVEL